MIDANDHNKKMKNAAIITFQSNSEKNLKNKETYKEDN
jgi:hypothetical protein